LATWGDCRARQSNYFSVFWGVTSNLIRWSFAR